MSHSVQTGGRDDGRGRQPDAETPGTCSVEGAPRLSVAASRCWQAMTQFTRAPVALVLLVGVIVLTVVGTVAHAMIGIARGATFIVEWAIPQYWVDYREGFVRRGFPGQVLAWLCGGPPTLAQVTWAGAVLSVAGLVAIAVVAIKVAAMGDRASHRALLLVVVVASPLTFSLITVDRGRYDALGMVALAVLLSLRVFNNAPRPWISAVVSGLVIAIAVASEEFLLAFLVPVALIGISRADLRRPGRVLSLVALLLGPGTVVAAASLAQRPPAHLIETTLHRAAAAGSTVPAPNAVSVLDDSLSAERALVSALSLRDTLLFVLVLSGCYVVTAFVTWVLVGRPQARWIATLAAFYGVLAIALGLIGVDYRRWWALAFLGLLSCFAKMLGETAVGAEVETAPRASPAVVPRWFSYVAVALLVLSIPGQYFPVFPR